MISVENLRKHYGDFVAVNGISFDIKKGEIVGFLGPNGAGKSTTMRMLTGFLEPTSGTAILSGFDVSKDLLGARRSIGYLPESAPMYHEMKVREYLDFIGSVHGISTASRKTRIREVAEMCGLRDRLSQDIGHLSKGYRQRVGLAQAMIHDPEILILDEPTSGLDPNQIIEIRSLIQSIGKKKTVILSTHILSEAEATCARVIIINKGSIVASGTLDELKAKNSGVQMIRIGVQGDPREIIPQLEKFEGVSRVLRSPGSETGSTTLHIQVEGARDLRKEIGSALVKAGFDLLEISREGKTLEDVFADLTKDSP